MWSGLLLLSSPWGRSEVGVLCVPTSPQQVPPGPRIFDDHSPMGCS